MTQSQRIEKAKQLRSEGHSYRSIASILGMSRSAVQYAVDDAYRLRQVLHDSRRAAKKYGWAACTATVEHLIAAYTGHCHCCGTAESEFSKRLSVDHDHTTGKFRGLICEGCNISLGHYENIKHLAERYLRT